MLTPLRTMGQSDEATAGSGAVLAALATAVFSASILLLISELIRISSAELRERVFAPRVARRLQRRREQAAPLGSAPECLPCLPGRAPLSWLPATIRVRDADLLPEVGLDAMLYLKFTRLVRGPPSMLPLMQGLDSRPLTRASHTHKGAVYRAAELAFRPECCDVGQRERRCAARQ